MFIEGEYAVRRYTASILQQVGQRWEPFMMQLDCVTTNYRLLLRPLRKRYDPASLPARYIHGIYPMQRGHHRCLALSLLDDHWLYLLLATGSLDHLYEDLMNMRTPPRYRFDSTIAKRDIQRLITFFDRGPLPQPTEAHEEG